MIESGWQGHFAIEKDKLAFSTLKHNLLKEESDHFNWPSWLPQTETSIVDFIRQYPKQIRALRGTVGLIAGGPPCQGFSTAGRRVHSDPRNSLLLSYLQMVKMVRPHFLLFENVSGFCAPFKTEDGGTVVFSEIINEKLKELKYEPFGKIVDLSDYGVPQVRLRYILIAVNRKSPYFKILAGKSPFDLLEELRIPFLQSKGLPHDSKIGGHSAISDLESQGQTLVPNTDSGETGFMDIPYTPYNGDSPYIHLMRRNAPSVVNSLRMVNHRKSTVEQFKSIMKLAPAGRSVPDDVRKQLGIKKHSLSILGRVEPSATITTLPDDMIHYSEPRVLTVRENARLQGFPDWFEFQGKYTTGNQSRKNECPRYSQVGNAVPPLFAEILGQMLIGIINTKK